MRKLASVLTGIVIAMVTISAVEAIGHAIFPTPPGVDMNDPAQVARIVDQISIPAKIWVTLAWFLGTLAGALSALLMARWRPAAWIIAGAVIAAAIWSFTMISHPFWMQVAGIFLPLLAARIAVARRRRANIEWT